MTKSILAEALETIDKTRQAEYSDPVENMVRQAIVMSVVTGKSVTPEEYVLGQLSQKMVRAGRGDKRDTTLDLAGYADILQRVRDAMKDGTIERIAAKLLPWLPFDIEKLNNPRLTQKDEPYGATKCRTFRAGHQCGREAGHTGRCACIFFPGGCGEDF